MNLTELPDTKRHAILREFGEGAQAWIDGFPALVTSLAERWQLELLSTAEAGLPINVIYFAETRAGEEVVLKVGHPHPEQLTEMIALEQYAGKWTPRVLASDRELGALLMERVRPGTVLRSESSGIDRSAIVPRVLAEISIKSSAVPGLPAFDEWMEPAFAEFRSRFGEQHRFYEFIGLAEQRYRALRDRQPDDWLLHGDLHHENLLKDERREWCAIDPKGVIGPKPLECGRFLHNFIEDEVPGSPAIENAHIDDLCEVLAVRFRNFGRALNMAHEDLVDACFIDCVLSCCWTINSNGWEAFDSMRRIEAARRMLTE